MLLNRMELVRSCVGGTQIIPFKKKPLPEDMDWWLGCNLAVCHVC
jgi:hypothetical protein